jgi:hypothetical protein
VWGCGGSNDQPAPDANDAGVITVAGLVSISGSTPAYRVAIEADSVSREVRGDLRDELARLQGARVKATGTSEGSVLVVTEYEILSIAGQTPVVGELEVTEEGPYVFTEAGKRVAISGAPPELLVQEGGKVWVILDSGGVVRGYGIIRERR